MATQLNSRYNPTNRSNSITDKGNNNKENRKAESLANKGIVSRGENSQLASVNNPKADA